MTDIPEILRTIDSIVADDYSPDPVDYRLYAIVRELAVKMQAIEARRWDGESS